MVNENPYLKDSLVFFKTVSIELKTVLTESEIINLTMHFSFGLERLLKGILYSLNPIYILMVPEFKNSLPVFYSSKIISEATGTKEVAETPNEDVITFRNSLLRAQLISKTAYNNKSLLFTISNARDIIAHHELSKLDFESLKILLIRDYYPLMKAFSEELNIKSTLIFHGKHIQLAKNSSALQETIEKQIELRFDALIETFKMLENRPGYMQDKNFLTFEAYNKGNKFLAKCPCCNNESLIYSRPIYEYNQYERSDIKIGNEIIKLKCFYCKLEIEDYKQLDYLKISIPKPEEQEKIKTCVKCQQTFASDTEVNICSNCNTEV